ncbi:unnamed protein product, partial [Symbiodinium sp. CCMP2456]
EEKSFKKFGESLLQRASKVSELQSSLGTYKEGADENRCDKSLEHAVEILHTEFEKVESLRAEIPGRDLSVTEEKVSIQDCQADSAVYRGVSRMHNFLVFFRYALRYPRCTKDPSEKPQIAVWLILFWGVPVCRGWDPGAVVRKLAKQAPCSHAVEMAKAAVEDSPNDVHLLPPALIEFSKIREKDAEEACHKLFNKYGLTVPVAIDTICAGNEGELKKLPVVKFSSWAKYLLDSDKLEQLVGVPEKEMEPMLEEFWQRYKALYPEHQVFVLSENQTLQLRRTVPVFAHVDEGRTYKSKALLILSVHGCLGKGTRSSVKRCVRKPHIKQDPMGTNYIGSTWKTHFTIGSLLRSLINADASCLDKLMAAFGSDMTDLATQGVTSECGDKRLWVQILAIKGDLPALGKIGNFVRNYSRVPKKQQSKKPCLGICWMCSAGKEFPHRVPFEDFRPGAAWTKTLFEERPWDVEPPVLAAIPCLPDQPEAFFMTDFWHNFHNGLAKFWVANALVMFVFEEGLIPARSIEKKLEWISADFRSYCKRVNITPFLTEFTRDNLSLDSFASYPQGLWSKAEVSTQTMLYLQDFCERFDFNERTPDKIFSGIASCIANIQLMFTRVCKAIRV